MLRNETTTVDRNMCENNLRRVAIKLVSFLERERVNSHQLRDKLGVQQELNFMSEHVIFPLSFFSDIKF